MRRKTNPIRLAAKKLAEIHLQSLDLAIDAIFSKSGIERVTNQPALDKFINKRFVHDIAALLNESTDGEIGEYGK